MPVCEEVAKEVYIELLQHVINSEDVRRESLAPVQIEIVCSAAPTGLRELNRAPVESLVVLPAMVASCGKPQHKAVVVRLVCKECGHRISMKLPAWQQSIDMPKKCASDSGDDDACGSEPYVVVPEESTYTDVQTLKLQDPPEDVAHSEMPQHVLVSMTGSLSGRLAPGQRAFIIGVYTSFDKVCHG